MKNPRLLMALRGDYIGEPSKGGLFFAREIALYLSQYMDVYLIGEDKIEVMDKCVWRKKIIKGKSFQFMDPYPKFKFLLGRPFDTFLSLKLSKNNLKGVKPNIIYLQEMDFLPLSSYGKPTVLHIHGCFKEMLGLRYPVLWKLRKYLPYQKLSYLQGIFRLWLLKKYLPFLSKIFISASNKQILYLKEKEPEIGAKMLSIPLLVDTELFKPTDKSEAREILNLPQEYFLILFVGGLEPLKSPQVLLQSFIALNQQVPKSLLIFIGRGRLEELLYQQVERAGLKSNVLFLGRIANETLPLFYNASDVFVLPSLYEGISMVAMEALACGTPVIVTEVNGVSEFIRDGVQGFVLKEANVEALSDALSKAKELPPETRGLCRETALQFSPQKVGSLIYESLLSLLSQ